MTDILSEEQSKYYNYWKTTGGSVMMPVLLKFKPDVDVEKLTAAIRTVIISHPLLSANVEVSETSAPVWKAQNKNVNIPVTDTTYRKLRKSFKSIKQWTEMNPDLHTGNLYFANVYRTASAVYLLMAFHHIYYDGITRQLIIEQIIAAYNGKELPQDTGHGFTEGSYEQEYRKTGAFAASEKFYNSLFQNGTGHLELKIPEKWWNFWNTGTKREHTAETVNAFIKGTQLRQFCKTQNVSPNIVFLTGLCCAARKFSDSDYIFFGTETAGRAKRSIDNDAGLFVRSFPLGIKFDVSLQPFEILQSVKEQYYHILKNHSAYSSTLAEKQQNWKNKFNYLYQVDIYAAKPPYPTPFFKDISHIPSAKVFDSREAWFDIDVQIYNFYMMLGNTTTDKYMVNVRYDAAVYSSAQMKQFAVAMRSFIEKLLL